VSTADEPDAGANSMKLTVRPLTPDLWPAFEDLFGMEGLILRKSLNEHRERRALIKMRRERKRELP
jgi:hypothetical protein